MTDKKVEETKEEKAITEQPKKKVDSIRKISTEKFLDKVSEQIIEKYANNMIQIIEDQKKLDRALKFVNGIISRVEGGDYTAIESYIKKRRKLGQEDDADFS